MSDKGNPIAIPTVSGGFSQKIDATHYLMGTTDNGVYRVTVDSDGMVVKAAPSAKLVGVVASNG